MIITFKSQASGDVMMFREVAESMMKIVAKEFAAKGIVTVVDLPPAIAKFKAAIAADTAARTDGPAHARGERNTASDGDREPVVGIAQRALPLVDLFERSLKNEVPVVWGV